MDEWYLRVRNITSDVKNQKININFYIDDVLGMADNRAQIGEKIRMDEIYKIFVTEKLSWISFDVSINKTYIIETFDLEENVDTEIALYDGNGDLLASNDDANDTTYGSKITWRARNVGTMFLRIASIEGEGKAKLRVQEIP